MILLSVLTACCPKDVKFSDLGLLVIDEEQRFGVKHKEKLKELKAKVDVLTLTATPIPRTLHMSMLGIRDLSIIETAPTNRYPVQTYVMETNPGLIREAILREMDRGGQIFMFIIVLKPLIKKFLNYMSWSLKHESDLFMVR